MFLKRGMQNFSLEGANTLISPDIVMTFSGHHRLRRVTIVITKRTSNTTKHINM